MRRVLVVGLLAAACGRVGFDATGDAPIIGRWLRASTNGEGTCAITKTGELWCWGSGAYGSLGNGAVLVQAPARVGTASDWQQVAVGDIVTCGLRSDQSLWCWGTNEDGVIPGAPANTIVETPARIGTGTWKQLAVAGRHACAIDASDALLCWGEGSLGVLGNGQLVSRPDPTPVSVVGTNRWTAIATSPVTTCGIQTDSSLWCWGLNNVGQVGDNSQTTRGAPVRVGAGHVWLEVTTGTDETCALEDGGQVWCWGFDIFGQLGDGMVTTVPQTTPKRSTVLPPVVSIDAGRAHVCGRTSASNGDVLCVGNAERGQFGFVQPMSATPLAVASSAQDVILGGDVTCVIDGEAHLACTGANNYGQLGAEPGVVTSPRQSDARADWTRVIAQENHACALTTANQLWCWGLNHSGELANGKPEDIDVPRDTGTTFTTIALGAETSALLAADTSLWLSGKHPDLSTKYLAPTLYAAAGTTKAIALGTLHGCRILADDSLQCGGLNSYGQLGDATTTDKPAVALAGTWRLVGAGPYATCAVSTAGALYCWGRNTAGKLGIGTTSDAHAPQLVSMPGATGAVTEIGIGFDFTCVLTAGGEIWCWGAGSSGQLGNGSTAGSTTPTRMGTATTWRHLAVGDDHACALATDNSLWCWGHGEEGETGPALANHTTPVTIGDAEWRDVAAGTHFTCALKLDGTRWCFGDNSNGALGTGGGWRDQFVVIP